MFEAFEGGYIARSGVLVGDDRVATHCIRHDFGPQARTKLGGMVGFLNTLNPVIQLDGEVL